MSAADRIAILKAMIKRLHTTRARECRESYIEGHAAGVRSVREWLDRAPSTDLDDWEGSTSRDLIP